MAVALHGFLPQIPVPQSCWVDGQTGRKAAHLIFTFFAMGGVKKKGSLRLIQDVGEGRAWGISHVFSTTMHR